MNFTLIKGLNSFQLKCFALFFMTLDHIALYTFNLNVGDHPLRILGRIAAPLFIYVLVSSAHHTRNKPRFVLRLYVAHVATSIFTFLLMTYGQHWLGNHEPFSIFATFTYTVLYIYIIENIVIEFRRRNAKKYSILIFAALSVFLLPFLVQLLFPDLNQELLHIFIPNLLTVEYSPIFVLMGICWYFVKSTFWKSAILVMFSFFSVLGSYVISRSNLWLFMDFFNPIQFWMVLVLPFLWLFNGQKGPSFKYFFYVYYPLHIYALMFLGQQIR